MALEISYSGARADFAHILDRVTDDQEVIVVKRRGKKDVAMISGLELESLIETAHLLRSPKNAQRLMSALQRALKKNTKPSNVPALKKELGLDKQTKAKSRK
jgi:antitoxin YefM